MSLSILKTPSHVYRLELHFNIAKLGYGGVYLFFLFLLHNIDYGYSLESPLSEKKEKYQNLSTENLQFLQFGKNLYITCRCLPLHQYTQVIYRIFLSRKK